MSFGTAPSIPTELAQYNSYIDGPKWQTKFTIVWCSVLAAAVAACAPALISRLRRGVAFAGVTGLGDDWGRSYESVPSAEMKDVKTSRSSAYGLLSAAGRWLGYSPIGTGLTVAQILLCAGYIALVLGCVLTNAPLIDNPNRAGFLALAQLPPVFLFATKNSLLSILLGGAGAYDKLNYVHRWTGRGLFLAAVVHGALWIRNHLQYDLQILGSDKETTGVAALACLCLIVLLSVRPVRAFAYQFFFYTHVCLYVAFFVCVCYHTIYAAPWIFPPIALYAADVLMRMLRFRIKDATLVPVGNEMTLIKVHNVSGSYAPGAHFRVRVLAGSHILESHPLTIASAPLTHTVTSSHSLLLAARNTGDWSRSLSSYARAEGERLALLDPKKPTKEYEVGVGRDEADGAEVQVTLDGPYGGLSLDLGDYESALLIAGGAGMSAILGVLDDIVGRVVRLGRKGGEKTRRIQIVWCIRSFGAIDWFATPLHNILTAASHPSANLDVHLSVFVTCLCNPSAVPALPNSAVSVARPVLHSLLREFISPSSSSSSPEDVESQEDLVAASSLPSPEDKFTPAKKASEQEDDAPLRADASVLKARWLAPHAGGGVAVAAAGPEALCRDARNAVARLGAGEVRRAGGVAVGVEVFAL
ncbi:hypothetical protein PENSPDRAFT_594068 [Peniophora sp. CONT]|nr:hypothetical protein PENSPDRAFT_594068 [Peniophora sp. CONT]